MKLKARMRPGLLVSVRSAAEAEAALAGGADMIDVKEPARGPLGAADPSVIRAVLAQIGGRVPVSAALGEWSDPAPPAWEELGGLGLAYLKQGLAGCAVSDWDRALTTPMEMVRPPTRMVLVAYADWQRAASVAPERLAHRAVEAGYRAFLIDTWGKDGSTLLDWLAADEVGRLTEHLHRAGVAVALAGSLGPPEIETLRPTAPTWFAVRGSVCTGGRSGRIDRARVAALSRLLREAPRGS